MPMDASTSRSPSRIWLIALVVIGAGGGVYYYRNRPAPLVPPPLPERYAYHPTEDPRIAYKGPLRNIRPHVRYVGDAKCAECHEQQTNSYRQHPMGRSMAPAAALAPLQRYDQAHHNPFEILHTRFTVKRMGDRVVHRQTRLDTQGKELFHTDMDVHYVVGSGRGGFSYITNCDGYLFQTPISWFSQKQIWDLSPGFNEDSLKGRPVSGDCLFCHSNRAHSLDNYQNRYEPPIFTGLSIGCERCHGPGELHAASSDSREIVNPAALAWPLREAVCQQCHLEGIARVVRRGREMYDFRPGLRGEDFWSVFVLGGSHGVNRKAVNHVEQMYQSRCFQGGMDQRKLGCISCHDPHVFVGPDRRNEYYRARCMNCHDDKGCTEKLVLRQKNGDICIDCHMPRYRAKDVAHISTTDHRIIRHIEDKAEDVLPEMSMVAGTPQFRPFGREVLDRADRDQARDLGIAYIKAASNGRINALLASNQSLNLLETALEETPADVDAWEAKGWALVMQNLQEEALAVFEQALARDPVRERSLMAAGLLAEGLDQSEKALTYWKRAVIANPRYALYRKHVSMLLMKKNAWDEVRRECQTWLQLDPRSTEARMMWISCLLREGRKDDAKAEFAKVESLAPAELGSHREWFSKQLK